MSRDETRSDGGEPPAVSARLSDRSRTARWDELAVVVDERVLHAAVAAYLGRYRVHTGSDLKVFLTWCAGQDLDPLSLGRTEIERDVRWLQEVRR